VKIWKLIYTAEKGPLLTIYKPKKQYTNNLGKLKDWMKERNLVSSF